MAKLTISVKKDTGIVDYWLTIGHVDVPTVEGANGIGRGSIDLTSPATHTLLYYCDGAADATIKSTATVGPKIAFEQTGRIMDTNPPQGFGSVTFKV